MPTALDICSYLSEAAVFCSYSCLRLCVYGKIEISIFKLIFPTKTCGHICLCITRQTLNRGKCKAGIRVGAIVSQNDLLYTGRYI